LGAITGWPAGCAQPYGGYAVSSAIARPLVELDLQTLSLKDLRFFLVARFPTGAFNQLVQHTEAKTVAQLVANAYPLNRIAEAQMALRANSISAS